MSPGLFDHYRVKITTWNEQKVIVGTFCFKTWRCRFCLESKVWPDKLSAAPRMCQNIFLGKYIIFKCNIDWGKSIVSLSLLLHWWSGDSEVTWDISINQNQDKSITGKSTGNTKTSKKDIPSMWSMLHRTSQKYHWDKKFGRMVPIVSL